MRLLEQLAAARAQHPKWSHERVYEYVHRVRLAKRQSAQRTDQACTCIDHATGDSYTVYFANSREYRPRGR